MDLVQLFAQIQGTTQSTFYREIDLYPEEPITYTKRVEIISEPTVVASDLTQTFRVPNTPNNSIIFKAAFNVNSVDYDPTLYCKSYLNVNGIYYSSGNLRLVNTFRSDSTGLIEYQIVFVGQVSTFAANINSKLMKDLDLSDLDYNMTYTNLLSSWAQTFLNGNIIFPLIEWGYTYDDNEKPEQSTLVPFSPLGTKGFSNPTHALFLNQFKPIIKLSFLWDRIFQESGGFSWESDFINSSFWENLYHLSTGESTSDAVMNNFGEFNCDMGTGGTNQWTMAAPSTVKLLISGIVVDTGNNIDLIDDEFHCPQSGPYLFQFKDGIVSFNNFIGNSTADYVTFYLFVNGAYSGAAQTGWVHVDGLLLMTTSNIWTDNTETSTIITFPVINLVSGDKVDIRMYNYFDAQPGSPLGNPFVMKMTQGNWICDFSTNISSLSSMFSNDYKQIDFIKGINERFKLVWVPDPNNDKNFLIEPWVDWIKAGSTYSWSDKLDENKDMDITPLFYDFEADLKFKDFEEQDMYNLSFFRDTKLTFGQLNLYSNIPVINGEKINQSYLSSLPLAPVALSDTFLIPHICQDTDKQRSPIECKPRIVFYNGLVPVPEYYPGGGGFPSADTWEVFDDLFVAHTMTTYPLISQFSGTIPFTTSSFDLNFNNSKQFWKIQNVGPAYGDGFTGLTSYTIFWKDWYESTFSKYSKKMVATFNLSYSDVVNLKFNDRIWIKDSWWFPTEIKDYKLGTSDNVQVELIKLYGLDYNLDGADVTYEYEGICGGSTPCLACCCEVPGYVLYGTTASFTQSFGIYSNPGLSIYPSPGFYLYSGISYELGVTGNIIGISTCGTCSCTGVLTNFFVCMQSTICFACCCNTFATVVWGNGASVDTSSQIWADSLGTIPVTPNMWYYQSGNTSVTFVGPDGFTVNMTAPCTCNCGGGGGNQLVLDTYNMSYDTGSSPIGGKVACCAGSYGFTQSKGVVSAYGSTSSFTASNSFYFDLFKDYPIGTASTGPLVLSDGEYFKVVTGGTAGSLNSCDYSSNCPDRTELVTFNVRNNTGIDVTLGVTSQISFDQVLNWWTYGSTSSGFTFSNTFTASYEPNSFIHCDIITGTAIGYLTIDRYIDSSLDNTQTYTTPGSISSEYFRVGTQSTMVNITWADTI